MGVTVPSTRVRHLSRGAQMGAGRGNNSEGPQRGPPLRLRWVAPTPHP